MPEFKIFELVPPEYIGMAALLVVIWWQQKSIQKFIDSQPQIAKALSELSTLINVLVQRGRRNGE